MDSSNSTLERPTAPALYSSLQITAFTVLYCLTMLVAFVGNVLLIFIVKRKPDTRSLTGIMFVNMAVADLLVTFSVMPINTAYFYTSGLKWLPGTLGHVTCTLSTFVFYATIVASILSLMLMSVDRYLAVVFPLRRFPRFRQAKVLTVVIWLNAMIFSIPAAVIWRFETNKSLGESSCAPIFLKLGKFGKKGFYMYLLLMMYVIPLLTISTLYILIGRALWIRSVPGRQLSSQGEHQNEKTKRKVVRTLIIITAVFALCWLPTHCYQIILAFFSDIHDKAKLPLYVMSLCFWLGHANSAINPWLYMLLSDNFRKALCDVVCRRKYSPRSKQNGASKSLAKYSSVGQKHSVHISTHQLHRNQGNGLITQEQWESCRETVL